ncbi:arginine/serine-rich coiled-coil protein 2-like isoform X2 [Cucurbita moschata]|uniref:Arginine/serine-rich coiled-coil protein 2-like isoform X2 n=1 Tax=Cucurbita moschata TaxID=3662 RepID=A0A6J1F0U7_CUCMO|nr:arginine/serine-rich coiled-coil protein 2-like isoform X2 [Cucurbita moschata]
MENTGVKSEFRKPSSESAGRKYRRRSPVSGSSSLDESPKRDRSLSPKLLRDDASKDSERQPRRKDDERDEERDNERLSSRSRRDSKGGVHYDHTRRDRSRDGDSLSERHGSGSRRHSNSEEMGKNRNTRDRDGRDEKRDNVKHSGDYKHEQGLSHDDARGNRYDSFSGRAESRHHMKEFFKSDRKELDAENFAKEERKYEDRETNWDKGQGKESKGKYDGKGVFVGNQASPAKKPKLLSSGEEVNHELDAEENQSSILKQEQDGKLSLGQGQSGDSDFAADFSAAKVAAMKAAELVNKNLVGVGYMSTDQKKKLLWGSKKSTAVEESGHQWDTALFTDRERQEKFNKLMSLRLPWCLWPIVGCEGRAEDGASTNQPRSQRTSPCREAKGAADGFRKAIHCWTTTKRWSNCGIRSLSILAVGSGLFVCLDEIVMRMSSLCCRTRVVLNVQSTTFEGMFFPSPPPLKTLGLWRYAFMKLRKLLGCLKFWEIPRQLKRRTKQSL